MRQRIGIWLAIAILAMGAQPSGVAYRCMAMGTVAGAPCCKHAAEHDPAPSGARLKPAVCCQQIASTVAAPPAVRAPSTAPAAAPLAIANAVPALADHAGTDLTGATACWLRPGPGDARLRIPSVVLRV